MTKVLLFKNNRKKQHINEADESTNSEMKSLLDQKNNLEMRIAQTEKNHQNIIFNYKKTLQKLNMQIQNLAIKNNNNNFVQSVLQAQNGQDQGNPTSGVDAMSQQK